MPVGAGERLAGIEQRDGEHDADQQRRVELPAADLQSADLFDVALDVADRFAAVVEDAVEQHIDDEQHAVDEHPLLPERERPEEGHAFQVAQEQRRIADRQQAAAAVADDEDEEHDRVGDVLALAVGFQAAGGSAASPRRWCR